MKKFLFISAFAFSIFILGSCKKKTDACENTTCYNGGVCNDGKCSCPTGYSGADCGTQISPTKITVSAIKLNKYPSQNGSSDWDVLAFGNSVRPDIYAEVKAFGSNNPIITTTQVANAAPQSYNLPFSVPIDFSNITQQYTIDLLDDDNPSSATKMGSVDFYLYNSTNKFPSKLVVADTSGTLEFELSLSYSF